MQYSNNEMLTDLPVVLHWVWVCVYHLLHKLHTIEHIIIQACMTSLSPYGVVAIV